MKSQELEQTPSERKKRVQFKLDEDADCEVFLAGSFNDWAPERMMYDKDKHLFIKKKMLLPGQYEYKFVVNGTWVVDARNEDFSYNNQGSMNSLQIVR